MNTSVLPRYVTLLVLAGLVGVGCASAYDNAGVDRPSTVPSTTPATTSLPPTTSTTISQRDAVTVYFIGNSLTWDTIGEEMDGFLSIDVLSRQTDDQKLHPNGYHINCGASLLRIAQTPTETCVEPNESGNVTAALDQPWDAVMIQPYPGPDSTLATDEMFIRQVADAVGPTTDLFLVTGWPPSADYRRTWDTQVDDDDEALTTHSRQYFELLISRTVDLGVTLIPTGEVLYELDRHLAAGEVPGMTDVTDLYRDDIHLDTPGQWAAGVTATSVILGADASQFGKPNYPWYGGPAGFSPEFISLVREVVTDVLSR